MSWGFDTYGGDSGTATESKVSGGDRADALLEEERRRLAAQAAAAAATPATPPATPFTPQFQAFTPEQLAAIQGFDVNAWFGQNAGVFNPQNQTGMNYAQTYAGTPVATGYVDQNGKFVGTPMLGAAQAQAMRSEDPLSWIREQFGEGAFTPLTQSPAYTGLSGLISEIRGYQPGGADQTAYVEKTLGLEPGSYGSTLGGMNQQLGGGIGGMQGLSAEEQSTFQRQAQQQIDSMREESRQIVGALAGSGRSIAAFDAMEGIAGQIADFGLQSQVELINNNWARKQLEYQALKDQRDFLVQSGMQGAEQYTQQLQSAWNTAITGYAQEISTLANENQQYAELWNQHAEATYKSYMMDLGLTEEAMNQSAELWAQSHMDELLAQQSDLLAEIMKG